MSSSRRSEDESDGRALNPETRRFIGKRIAQLRTDRGWNRNQLAARMGGPSKYKALSNIEKGLFAPSLKTLLGLVAVFDLGSVEELLGGPLGGTSRLRQLEGKSDVSA